MFVKGILDIWDFVLVCGFWDVFLRLVFNLGGRRVTRFWNSSGFFLVRFFYRSWSGGVCFEFRFFYSKSRVDT